MTINNGRTTSSSINIMGQEYASIDDFKRKSFAYQMADPADKPRIDRLLEVLYGNGPCNAQAVSNETIDEAYHNTQVDYHPECLVGLIREIAENLFNDSRPGPTGANVVEKVVRTVQDRPALTPYAAFAAGLLIGQNLPKSVPVRRG